MEKILASKKLQAGDLEENLCRAVDEWAWAAAGA